MIDVTAKVAARSRECAADVLIIDFYGGRYRNLAKSSQHNLTRTPVAIGILQCTSTLKESLGRGAPDYESLESLCI